MYLFSKRNIVIPSPDGGLQYRIPRDYIGPVPDWVTKTDYFAALVADGKLLLTTGTDKDIDKKAAKPVASRRGGKPEEESGEKETPEAEKKRKHP